MLNNLNNIIKISHSSKPYYFISRIHKNILIKSLISIVIPDITSEQEVKMKRTSDIIYSCSHSKNALFIGREPDKLFSFTNSFSMTELCSIQRKDVCKCINKENFFSVFKNRKYSLICPCKLST